MHLLIALSPLDLSTESIVEYIFIPLHFSPPIPRQANSPLLQASFFLSFFPWLWLWLEEQCQPLFDTLFAAKCIVCLVEEECCRRDIELVTFWRWPRPGATFLSYLHGNLHCWAAPQDSPYPNQQWWGDQAGFCRPEIHFTEFTLPTTFAFTEASALPWYLS